MTNVETFAHNAEGFCAWVASAPGTAATEAAHLRRRLAALYASALDLPRGSFAASEPAEPTRDEWHAVYRRSGALPFNYYSHADPLQVPTDAVTIGDLADDVADIWRDLMVGLSLFRDGRTDEAASEWRERFDSHWARHATDALAALQAWHQQNAHD